MLLLHVREDAVLPDCLRTFTAQCGTPVGGANNVSVSFSDAGRIVCAAIAQLRPPKAHLVAVLSDEEHRELARHAVVTLLRVLERKLCVRSIVAHSVPVGPVRMLLTNFLGFSVRRGKLKRVLIGDRRKLRRDRLVRWEQPQGIEGEVHLAVLEFVFAWVPLEYRRALARRSEEDRIALASTILEDEGDGFPQRPDDMGEREWLELIAGALQTQAARAAQADTLAEKGPLPPRNAEIGRYVIGPVLGEGGFGTVQKAFDMQGARFVAVKVPRAPKGKELPETPTFEFLNEVHIALGLSRGHPNIVETLDVYRPEGERGYRIVSAFVRGGNVRKFLYRDALALHKALEDSAHDAQRLLDAYWAQCMRIVRGILRGLDMMHALGLIHDDIKPENVMLTTAGEAKITDFGLAYVAKQTTLRAGELRTPEIEELEPVAGEELFPTLRGPVKTKTFKFPPQLEEHEQVYRSKEDDGASGNGTPGYMAPERLIWKDQGYRALRSGGVEQPGRPADVWAVGIVVLDMVLQPLGYKPADYQFTKIPTTRSRAKAWYAGKLSAWLDFLPDDMPQLREALRTMLAYSQNKRLRAKVYRDVFARIALEAVDVDTWRQKLKVPI